MLSWVLLSIAGQPRCAIFRRASFGAHLRLLAPGFTSRVSLPAAKLARVGPPRQVVPDTRRDVLIIEAGPSADRGMGAQSGRSAALNAPEAGEVTVTPGISEHVP